MTRSLLLNLNVQEFLVVGWAVPTK